MSLPRARAGLRLLREAWQGFLEDEGPLRATGLAYVSLLALVPLTAVTLGVLAAFPVFERLAARVNAFVFRHFLPETGETVQRAVETLAANAGRLGLVGALMLVATALLMMAAVDGTLNRIWRVRTRAGLWQRLAAWWTVLTLGPVLLGSAIALATYAAARLPGSVAGAEPQRLLLGLLALLLEAGACALLYALVPRRPVPVRHALAGAAVAAVLLELARRGFGAYVASAGTYRTLYGPLAALPLLLIWVQVSWMVVLYGAEVSRALSLPRGAPPEGMPAARLAAAMHALGRLAAAQRTGEAPATAALARGLTATEAAELEGALERLGRAGLVRRAAGGGWVLARGLGHTTAAELADALGLLPPAVAARGAAGRIGALLAEGREALRARLDVPLASLYGGAPERPEGK